MEWGVYYSFNQAFQFSQEMSQLEILQPHCNRSHPAAGILQHYYMKITSTYGFTPKLHVNYAITPVSHTHFYCTQ